MSDMYRQGRWDAQCNRPSQAAAGRWPKGTFAWYDYTEGYEAVVIANKWAAIGQAKIDARRAAAARSAPAEVFEPMRDATGAIVEPTLNGEVA